MNPVALRVLPWVTQTRRLSVACGVALLLGLAAVPEGRLADRLALMALVVLGLATAIGWFELWQWVQPRALARNEIERRSNRAWAWATIAVVVVAGLAVQTWFRPGTTVGGGDVVIPDGTAWIGRLFEPWTWSGSALGGPSQLPLKLPWAAVIVLVHAFGGDQAVAQRVFYTTLYVGAGLAALGLLASLRMGPIAALVGALVYLFNPYVVTWVNTYDVYLAALLLLPAIPAALVAASTGRFSIWWSAFLVAAASPLLGFAFFEPPLVGMVLVAMFLTPLVVAWAYGRDAAGRSLRTVLLAIPLLVGTSAYWAVPAIIHLSDLHLSSSGIFFLPFNWIGGEIRDTVRNAFWLNTRWMWIAPEYFPYAKTYEALPLSMFRFVLPALAFSALAIASNTSTGRNPGNGRVLRLAVAIATPALFLILLTTGTNPPGNIVFDQLYKLPFGWLLQEPERFIMVVALAYAIMIAIVVESLIDHPSVIKLISYGHLNLPALSIARLVNWRRSTLSVLRLSIVPVALGTAFLVGFPLYTGALVPDAGRPLPIWGLHARPQHTTLPTYWTDMAQFADSLPIQGSIVVMPPDDFYEMPYTWYYGADDFIAQLFKRHVLVPSYPPSGLVKAVDLTSQSILSRDWARVESLVTALNAPLILVRRDIVAPYPVHSIVAPDDLAAALETAPNFVLVRRIGSLDLFALRGSTTETDVGPYFTMVNTQTPDLRLLSVLPPHAALVSGAPRAQVPSVVQAPPLELWRAEGSTLTWQSSVSSADSAYQLAELQSKVVVPLDRPGTFTPSSGGGSFSSNIDPLTALTALPGSRSAISNGDFSKGVWGSVIDCHRDRPVQAKPKLTARVLKAGAPGGSPALQLFASSDSACVRQRLHWRGGPLVISLMLDRVLGTGPQICLWEVGPNRCALAPAIQEVDGWSSYRVAITPDVGTKALDLYLYADAYRTQSPTISKYALVRIIEIPKVPTFAVSYSTDASNNGVTVSVVGRIAVSNGDFKDGSWGEVGDCHAFDPVQAKPNLSANVLPNAAPGGLAALELGASFDSACVNQVLAWRGGPLLLHMMVNHVLGAPPNVCLWEAGPNHCATLPSMPAANGWSSYDASVSPDLKTTAVTLYLYADAVQPGGRTVNQYADVRVIEVPEVPSFALLATPDALATLATHLVVTHNSYSTLWQGPANSEHVLVDGMLNGWLISTGSNAFTSYYGPASAFAAAQWISLVAYLLMILWSLRSLTTQLPRRPGRRWWSRPQTGKSDKV